MRKDFLIFGSPYIGEEEIKEVVSCLRSGWISTGPRVAKFEEAFKQYIGTPYAAALNSCTAGLHLSLIAAGIGKDDEVILPAMTFAATGNVILHCGARPVFIDVDRTTMTIDSQLIEKKITARTKAIMPVHFAGRPCDMDSISSIARKYKLMIIEDAAHAVGAEYRGKKIGTIGDFTVFSFYVTKNLVTGEGGMVTTPHQHFIEMIQTYALHGMSIGAWKRYSDAGFKHYEVMVPGYKYNMMDLQAAMGIHQLQRLESDLKRREGIWQRYDAAFVDLPVILPPQSEPNTRHARHLYTLLLDIDQLHMSRDAIQKELYRRNIGTGIHFTALHLHPYYRKTFGYDRGDFPNAEWISDRTISLPLSSRLLDQDVYDVVDTIEDILTR